MKAVAVLALVLLAGCATNKPNACRPLPAPSGQSLAAQAAYAHVLIPLYAECATLKAKP